MVRPAFVMKKICGTCVCGEQKVTEKVWRLGVAHSFLHALDLILNVAVGDKNIWPAVVVIVEEETSKAECDQRGPPYFRLWGFVDKQAIAFVVVERHHLIGKVADDDTG